MKRKLIFGLLILTLIAATLFAANCTTPAPEPPDGEEELVVTFAHLGSEIYDPEDHYSLAPLIDVNEMLLRPNYDDEPFGYYPSLAESYEVSEDGLVYDFYIRQGVQWHDGWGNLTAEDVQFTIEFLSRPESLFPDAYIWWPPDFYGYTESFEVVDTYHWRHTLAQPYSLLPWVYAVDAWILCKDYYEAVGPEEAKEHPIGTGPWQYSEQKFGEYAKFEAVENHWRKTPEFKYLTLRIVPELASRIAMLKTGDADIVIIPAEKMAELALAGMHFKVAQGTQDMVVDFGGQYLPDHPYYDPTCPWVWHHDEPMDSEWNQRALKVRQALSLAINKDAIVDQIFHGAAQAVGVTSILPGTVWHRPEWEPRPYDLEQARALLAEAGYADGFGRPITFWVYASAWEPRIEAFQLAVASDLEALGIDIEITATEETLLVYTWAIEQDTAWQITGSPLPIQMIPLANWLFYYPSFSFYNSGFMSPVFDGLYLAAITTVDPDDTIEAVHAAGDYLYNSWCEVDIIADSIMAMSPRLGPAEDWKLYEPALPMWGYEYITLAD
jgi:peptide/nickel transport system substrate-binding protein